MLKCLDCRNLKTEWVKDENAPKMFQQFLYLHCEKYNHAVVGYDRKNESTECIGYQPKGE